MNRSESSFSNPSKKNGHLSSVTSTESTGDSEKGAQKTPLAFAQAIGSRAKTFALDLPKTIEREVRENPVRTLGLVCAVGFGGGLVLGSRVLRGVATSVLVYAVTQVANRYVREVIEGKGASEGSFGGVS